MSSKTMKALVTTGQGQFELQKIDVPITGSREILVKVCAASQNPTDWKTLHLQHRPGNVIGCDFAGTVACIGADVPQGMWKIGQRVAGAVHGGVSRNGAFAEYVLSPAEFLFALPDTWSFEEGAQLGVACLTTCQSLYQVLKLPTPLEPTSTPTDILIWSGTSSTGQYAVQFAKLAGLRVISTASPKNFDLVKSLGADEVFDYMDSFTARTIRRVTSGILAHAMDCISEGMTPNQVSMSLRREGGTIATLLPYESMERGVKTEFVLAYSVLGKDIEIPFRFPANPEHHRNGIKYVELVTKVLAEHTIKPVPVKLYPRGLESVADGFEDMKIGKIHAEKVTYRISDTPGLCT